MELLVERRSLADAAWGLASGTDKVGLSPDEWQRVPMPLQCCFGMMYCMLQWRKGKGKGEKRKKEVQRFRGGDSARLRLLNMAPLMPMLQETETVKEIVVIRNPPAAHVYNVVEHGRR